MTPSEKVLSLALKKTTADIWSTDERDQLTVKFVRTKVEFQHDLDEGFFRTPTWKDKSKHIIEDEAVSYAGSFMHTTANTGHSRRD